MGTTTAKRQRGILRDSEVRKGPSGKKVGVREWAKARSASIEDVVCTSEAKRDGWAGHPERGERWSASERPSSIP